MDYFILSDLDSGVIPRPCSYSYQKVCNSIKATCAFVYYAHIADSSECNSFYIKKKCYTRSPYYATDHLQTNLCLIVSHVALIDSRYEGEHEEILTSFVRSVRCRFGPLQAEPCPCSVQYRPHSGVGPNVAHGDSVAEGSVAQTPRQLTVVPRLVSTTNVAIG